MSTPALKKKLAEGGKPKLTREERLAKTIRGKLDKHAQRKQLFEKIVGNSMTSDTRQLLKASSAIGKKETNKESIERQLLEQQLHVDSVVPKDKYAKDTPIDRKKMTKAIPDSWDDIDQDDDDFKQLANIKNNKQAFQMPKEVMDAIARDKKLAAKEKKEETELQGAQSDLPKRSRGPKQAKKDAVVKKQEITKKKYFFWSKDAQEQDFEEYDDLEEAGKIRKVQQLDNDSDQDSEDENTIELKGNTGDKKDDVKEIKQEEKKQEVDNKEINNNNKSVSTVIQPNKKKDKDEEKNNNINNGVPSSSSTTSTTTTTTTTINNKKVKGGEKRKKENEKEKEEEIIKKVKEEEKEDIKVEELNLPTLEEIEEEKNRYTLSIDEFGKHEEENRVIMLSEQVGLEILEQKIKEELSGAPIKIKYNVFHVQVERTEEVKEVRDNLPIMMEEHSIVEKVKDNDVIIICGETGSGKTTQVPQFLYESGFGHPESDFPGLIGVTQPRRVAAVSTAKRVAEELNVEFGKEVGYQIRYDKHLDTQVNKIKFMTDGILLREVQSDFLLTKYSAIIIDEAHERNLNTDILIGLLSRIVPMRQRLFMDSRRGKNRVDLQDADGNIQRITPLKLIIMSATLRVEDFTKNSTLFSSVPPVINIPTRQFPVTIHFNKKTVLDNYIDEAHKKVVKIHQRLPEGGVLVFVTGRQEVEHLCSKLRRSFPMTKLNKSFKENQDRLDQEFKDADKPDDDSPNGQCQDGDQSTAGMAFGDMDDMDSKVDDQIDQGEDIQTNQQEEDDQKEESLEIVNDSDIEDDQDDDEEDKEQIDGEQVDGEESKEEDKMVDDDDKDDWDSDEGEGKISRKDPKPLYVLPLYSNLATARQMRVFQTPPKGCRLVVVATNLAETSLTIPNIKYVVDTGRVKGRFYNKENGISSFDVTWTSRASADQRAGRAGRTGPGHCYRIYSSALFGNYFEQFSKPEILLLPIDAMVLQMKSMGIDNVQRFPFPTPPEEVSLRTALRTLVYLGALVPKTYRISPVGQLMSRFPVSPRYARMIMLGRQQDCLAYVIAIVAILTVKNPFVVADDVLGEEDAGTMSRLPALEEDATRREVEEHEKEEKRRKAQTINNSYRKWIHRESDVLTVLKVVGAYDFQMKRGDKRSAVESFCSAQFLNLKSMSEIYKLRLQLTSIIEQVLSEQDDDYVPMDSTAPLKPPSPNQELYLKQVITAGLIDQIAKLTQAPTQYQQAEYTSCITSTPIYIHPMSNLTKTAPEYVVYVDVIETKRPYMKMVTDVNPAWLAMLGRPMCAEFKSLEDPSPKYSVKRDKVVCYVKPSFGHHSWEMPLVAIDHPLLSESTKYFGKALLDGVVFNNLLYLVPFLTTRSQILTMPNTQSKVFKLLDKLRSKRVNTRQRLIEVWSTEPSFLLSEYLLWIDDSIKELVKSMWPPLDSTPVPSILKEATEEASGIPLEYREDDNNDNYFNSF